jgi:cyanate permease
MNKQKIESNDWPGQTRESTIRLAKWTILWVLTVTIPAFGPALFWGENILINSLAILLNIGVGIGMIMAMINHLKKQDEMMQKVQLEAMGISLGVTVVAGIAFSMLGATNVIPFEAEISYLVMIIAITYLVSVFINLRRYK